MGGFDRQKFDRQTTEAVGNFLILIFTPGFYVFLEFVAIAFGVTVVAFRILGFDPDKFKDKNHNEGILFLLIAVILVLFVIRELFRAPYVGAIFLWILTTVWGIFGGAVGWNIGYKKTETHPPDWMLGSGGALIGACVLFFIGFKIHSSVRTALREGSGGSYGEGSSDSSYSGESALPSGSRGGPPTYIFRVMQKNERGMWMMASNQYVRADSRWAAEQQLKGQYPSSTSIMYVGEE